MVLISASAALDAPALSVIARPTPASRTMNSLRESGYAGSIGTYAAPAFQAAKIPITRSMPRSSRMATLDSVVVPAPQRRWARRFARSSSWLYVIRSAPHTAATASGWAAALVALAPALIPLERQAALLFFAEDRDIAHEARQSVHQAAERLFKVQHDPFGFLFAVSLRIVLALQPKPSAGRPHQGQRVVRAAGGPDVVNAQTETRFGGNLCYFFGEVFIDDDALEQPRTV